jgi:hypothetical protein
VSTPTPYEICLEQREWYRRDPVTGNFVRDDPPVQFTFDDLLAALEAKATDKALIQQQRAEIERLSAALEQIAEWRVNGAPDKWVATREERIISVTMRTLARLALGKDAKGAQE